MKAIVCVDKNWGIGKNGDLLVSCKKDMQFFKETTMNKTIIMGRKTLESFKDAKPLKNRINVVLSSNDLKRDDIIQFNSIDEFLNSSYYNEDSIVIGGGSIYKQMLPYCDEIYVTKILGEYEADTFFPNLDELDYEIVKESEEFEENEVCFKFLVYKKTKN